MSLIESLDPMILEVRHAIGDDDRLRAAIASCLDAGRCEALQLLSGRFRDEGLDQLAMLLETMVETESQHWFDGQRRSVLVARPMIWLGHHSTRPAYFADGLEHARLARPEMLLGHRPSLLRMASRAAAENGCRADRALEVICGQTPTTVEPGEAVCLVGFMNAIPASVRPEVRQGWLVMPYEMAVAAGANAISEAEFLRFQSWISTLALKLRKPLILHLIPGENSCEVYAALSNRCVGHIELGAFEPNAERLESILSLLGMNITVHPEGTAIERWLLKDSLCF